MTDAFEGLQSERGLGSGFIAVSHGYSDALVKVVEKHGVALWLVDTPPAGAELFPNQIRQDLRLLFWTKREAHAGGHGEVAGVEQAGRGREGGKQGFTNWGGGRTGNRGGLGVGTPVKPGKRRPRA